jgi:hypothetical protein
MIYSQEDKTCIFIVRKRHKNSKNTSCVKGHETLKTINLIRLIRCHLSLILRLKAVEEITKRL